MIKHVSILLLLVTSALTLVQAQQQNAKPSLKATRVTHAPKIDAVLNDRCWDSAGVAQNFRQYDPVYNTAPSFNSSVRIVYDDKAIYVAAELFDSNPDDIKKQLSIRDNDGLNADYFYIGFDTYNNQQDAYYFGVSASGVQVDMREADYTYNAVWSSEVEITEFGWVVEMKIPYSALRFPKVKNQEWGMQIKRTIRRNREEIHWALQQLATQTPLNDWGTLTGLTDINPPLRLSFLPYLSGGIQHNSDNEYKSKPFSTTYNGGVDIKWGLNESFTLDMIMMPDFSQVQSDVVVKNLSAFETVYNDNRPFFNEGIDLFQKGNLFYSRRIGRTPLNYDNLALNEDEQIVSNPQTARLLNAVKVSGRTASGTGLGFFNAITGNTWAICSDSASKRRKILTDPVTNYNIMVIDQNLPNNSSVYLINTNVNRPNGWNRSNVVGSGFKLREKSNVYQLVFDLSMSSIDQSRTNSEGPKYFEEPGLYYNINFSKIKGHFRYSIQQNAMDKTYNRNDLGLNHTNDWVSRNISASYNIYEPFSIFRRLSQGLSFYSEHSISTQKNLVTVFKYNGSSTFKNYFSIWYNVGVSPFDRYDFYEAREPGRVFKSKGYNSYYFAFSSDYRKVFALDGDIDMSNDYAGTKWNYYRLQPIVRLSDKFKISPESSIQQGIDDKGYVETIGDSIYFGNRDIQTLTNSISGDYTFNNKISLSLWVRHYWQKGAYNRFYLLENDGSLVASNYTGDHNYNYNSFNVDLVLSWEFSPGSLMNLVWKNAIQQENELHQIKYFNNFDRMISSPQINNLSVKFLYYLDYQMFNNNKLG